MKNLKIRRAELCDIPGIDKLLFQVHKVHSDIRPDLFKQGAKKYTDEELERIIADDTTPIFVAEDEESGEILGYAFCVHLHNTADGNMINIKTLYIDDLCVDEAARGMHVGTALYEFVTQYAEHCGCYNITLNVWEGNDSAMKFYKKVGLKTQKTVMEKIL